MIVKTSAFAIVALSAILAVGINSADPPRTTDEWAGLSISTPTPIEPTPKSTPTSAPIATPVETTTPAPMATPVSKEYAEPEYIGKATAAVTTHPEMQTEIWGRDLGVDEVDSVGRGIAAWVTADFERRCMMPDGQVDAVRNVVLETFPSAEYRCNQSQRSRFNFGYGERHRWFADWLTTRRTVDTLYSYVDENGDTRWIKIEISMNVLDCSTVRFRHFTTAYAPTIWIGGRAYKPDEAPSLTSATAYDLGLWGAEIRGLKPHATVPLQPYDVTSDDPSKIICRRNCG